MKKTSRTPQQKRSRQLVTDLHTAIELLIGDSPPKSLTVHEIATKAGISVGSLYQYFSNKDDLIRNFLDERRRLGITQFKSDWPSLLMMSQGEFVSVLVNRCLGMIAYQKATRDFLLAIQPEYVVDQLRHLDPELSAAISYVLQQRYPTLSSEGNTRLSLIIFGLIFGPYRTMIPDIEAIADEKWIEDISNVIGIVLQQGVGGDWCIIPRADH